MRGVGTGAWAAARVLAAVALVMVAGCSPSQAQEDPEPELHYARLWGDLCDQLRLPDIIADFDLKPFEDEYDPFRSRYSAGPGIWLVGCGFLAEAADGRYPHGTLDRPFRPGGSISLEVEDPKSTRLKYGDPSSRYANFYNSWSSEPIDGWWDEGMVLESTSEYDEDDLFNPDATTGKVQYYLYHENLYMDVYVRSDFATVDTAEAMAELHELARTLIAEAIGHVPLTEDG